MRKAELYKQARGALLAQWIITSGMSPQLSWRRLADTIPSNPTIKELDDAINSLCDEGHVEYVVEAGSRMFSVTEYGIRQAMMNL